MTNLSFVKLGNLTGSFLLNVTYSTTSDVLKHAIRPLIHVNSANHTGNAYRKIYGWFSSAQQLCCIFPFSILFCAALAPFFTRSKKD